MIYLRNTMTGVKERFEPFEDNVVKMYVCGPTVYNLIHIGNARAAVVFDVLRRYLEYRGYRVIYVQNFTDIDDKIINRANELGVDPTKLAEKYINEYRKDARELGIRDANFHPKTTDYLKEIVGFIDGLLKKGFAYVSDGDVYFSVRKFKEYGKLSHRNIDDMVIGARIEPGEKKRDPLDFALWKSAKPGEPSWESPWGYGRPGWHIECSAMSTSLLGESFDIHAGGTDLIFPHHENEIAQTEALTGKIFVKYWLHNGMVNFKGDKMSKSKGNFVILREALRIFGKDAVRYFLLSKHYRSPMDAFEEALENAKVTMKRARDTLRRIEEKLEMDVIIPRKESAWLKNNREKIVDALDDDFNTPKALGFIFDIIKELNTTEDEERMVEGYYLVREEFGPIFGLFDEEEKTTVDLKFDEMVESFVELRNEYRKMKRFDVADSIRSTFSKVGITLKDTPDGTKWEIS